MLHVVPLTVHTWSQYYLLQKKNLKQIQIYTIQVAKGTYEIHVPKFKGFTILLTFHLQSSDSHGTTVLLGQW
jgi:hypothetical protein